MGVCSHGNGREVVTYHHDTVILKTLQPFKDRPNDFLIKVFNGLYFFFIISCMSRLVRGLYMQVQEIKTFQALEAFFSLPKVIGIQETGGPLYVDRGEACIDSDPVNEIHR